MNKNEDEQHPWETRDPAEFGIRPYSLADVEYAGVQLLQSMKEFLVAIRGCTTPLNLHTTRKNVESWGSNFEEHLEMFIKAKDIIEQEGRLAPSFDGGSRWTVQDNLLSFSPLQLISLAQNAKKYPGETITYGQALQDRRDRISARSFTPVVTTAVRDVDIAVARFFIERMHREILKNDCTTCGATVGQPCRVRKTGYIALAPHKPRWSLSVLANSYPAVLESGLRFYLQELAKQELEKNT